MEAPNDPAPLDQLRAVTTELSGRLAGPDTLANPTLQRAIIDQFPDAVVVVNEAGEMIHVNRRAELIFGYPRSAMLGQSVDMLLPDQLRGAHAKHRAGFFDNPRSRQMGQGRQLLARHHRGHEFPVLISLEALVTEDGNAGFAVIRKVD